MSKSATQQAAGRSLIALIADEDSTTGFILAGIGDVDKKGNKNFFVVDNKVPVAAIEEAFVAYTTEREDIAIVLINQHIADKIRPLMEKYTQAFPAVLEIPSKDHPYDPAKDAILKRVQKLLRA
ncbi:H(+)-transporting V1 sector ATPase subunit F [Malassezia vespertilionis]|uniref:H(+)-transporting V1 sector ATPase subunit F n=1 Tax=Malassezia vespertilionis TaxID=2020962 RepID=UPI0024B0E21F|nr:H(+)-transporting V1 sector ATPase subunit F [Malassezia vespertilionis]WFD07767.1 H(+)-transporting V1 sector ATPase subunit F [Malassezia vespertilionis]